jgi:hypothetical protein
MKILWNMILQRVNAVSKQVQRRDIELGLAVKQLESLCAFVADLRENVHQYEALATDHEKHINWKFEENKEKDLS